MTSNFFKNLDDDNFAKDFINAFIQFSSPDDDEEAFLTKLDNLLENWQRKYPDDANYICAYLLTHCMYMDGSEIRDYMLKATKQRPRDESSYDILMGAVSFILSYIKDNGISQAPSGKFKDLTCREFSKKLLEFQYLIHTDNPAIFTQEFLSDFNDLLNAWGEKCPDDANFTCAIIIYQIQHLSNEEAMDLYRKLQTQKPSDKEVYDHLFAMAEGALRHKWVL